MIKKLEIKTNARSEIIDITDKIQKVVSDSKIKSGICIIYVPHTTAGITVNENYDPSVRTDILDYLEKIAPPSARYRHTEGNADSHIKTSVVGSSATLVIEDGKILLGSWQGIMFCEFDGPRTRKLVIKVLEG
ncbi:MAG: hypothetical protein RBG1_1C00001G1429 [candidate division Zixibacteria bacterium RBG-1]|nr:MAG: hypothetical protein RBG1_1C00001G1429 [candidate division Zixibacteria bacterium RBG-1]OGC85206.1 MAG: hypothetical protein A2V73_01235 [candidate division Zixibacteria bacterium RBG_19FT_COMBO_42_43]